MSTLTHDAAAVRSESHALSAVDWGLLILRLALGVIFIAHGGQKVLGWFGGSGLAATVEGMGKMGIPAPLAYLASFTEFFGGLCVLVGLLSRLGALGLAVVMSVAILKVHLPSGFFMEQHGFEYPLALLGMALAVVIAGPGRLSVADWEGRILKR